MKKVNRKDIPPWHRHSAQTPQIVIILITNPLHVSLAYDSMVSRVCIVHCEIANEKDFELEQLYAGVSEWIVV